MALPMGVITTVGFTAFTRICREASREHKMGGALSRGTNLEESSQPCVYLVGPEL